MLPAGSPLSAWLTWLETLHPREIELGLERVRDVLGRLPLQRPDHVFLIAGTNGKGSSVAMTDALLRAAGLHTGVYTSPHIIDYKELDEIADGMAAANFYQEAIRPDTTPERKADLEKKLLKYCWVDTAAMVEIVRFLSAR